MASLRPPNWQNKKRKQRRAVERFEGEVISLVDEELKKKYQNNFRDKKSRQNYAEKLVKTKIISIGNSAGSHMCKLLTYSDSFIL